MANGWTAWGIWLVIGVSGCLGATGRGLAPTPSVSEAVSAEATSAPAPPAAAAAADAPVGEVSATALADQAVLGHLPKGDAQWEALCGRGHDDLVTDKLCANRRVRSLVELQSALGLQFVAQIGNGELGNPAFALLSHSTSLTGRSASPINPRVFVFTNPASTGPIGGPPKPDPNFVALAFVRGEPLVELVTRDRTTKELRFFLVRFDLPCELGACNAWDLYGPEVERSWTGLSVYDDGDLVNTAFDCNVCHQPGGPTSPKMLRMIEQRPPWTHFFRDNDEGKGLVADYFTAHDRKETYGGIPGQLISWSEPARLEGLVEHEGFIAQPLELPTRALAQYVTSGRPLVAQPRYAELRAKAKAGEALPVPHPSARFVAPDRFRAAAAAFRETKSGKRDQDGFPPLADLHSDEAAWRSGLAPEPGSDGASVLAQMCSRCHNGALDQRVTRARFDASRFASLGAAEKKLAIERMKLPSSSPLAMPPPRFGRLTPAQIDAATEALSR